MQLQFKEMIDEINLLKTKREEGLLRTSYFRNHPDYVRLVIRLTYELTDKDFEYFIAYVLTHEHYSDIVVQGGKKDGGIDIKAKKDGKQFYIQCKQWAIPYITLKHAGEFYATIYPIKKANPDVVFAYITTSFIRPETLDFFHAHGINGAISNGKLLESCRELGLLTEEGWKRMIRYIEQQRILEMRKQAQTSLPVAGSELQKLQKQRVWELRNHLQASKHKAFIIPNSIDFGSHFFLYWNLT